MKVYSYHYYAFQNDVREHQNHQFYLMLLEEIGEKIIQERIGIYLETIDVEFRQASLH